MRILFAVSNDNITTSVVNKYQQKYKEIITSKNVYYFNAIIKELQRNKNYDAVVIGEDLEPISNNNYDAIDKFLFEKLDSISDEASKPTGEDIPVILICSDRRTTSDQLLIKLFGIGIYNAIIGNDRSIDTVCNLINKPRNKKEAKFYYKVESDEIVPYQHGSDLDVSETEIQNILNHYRKIGLNPQKCAQSFDSIADQYNETQLRIIIKFLPKEVKELLEANSSRYNKLVSKGTVLTNGKYSPYQTTQNPRKPGKLDILTKDLEKTKLTKPVIIPSTININKDDIKMVQKSEPKVVDNMTRRPMQNSMSNNVQNVNARPMQNNQVNSNMGFMQNNSTNMNSMQNNSENVDSMQNNNTNLNDLLQSYMEANEPIMNDAEFNGLEPKDMHMNTNMPIESTVTPPLVQSENNGLGEVKKRGRGRPKKSVEAVVPKPVGLEYSSMEENATKDATTDKQVASLDNASNGEVKRRRGRPSKKVSVDLMQDTTVPVETSSLKTDIEPAEMLPLKEDMEPVEMSPLKEDIETVEMLPLKDDAEPVETSPLKNDIEPLNTMPVQNNFESLDDIKPIEEDNVSFEDTFEPLNLTPTENDSSVNEIKPVEDEFIQKDINKNFMQNDLENLFSLDNEEPNKETKNLESTLNPFGIADNNNANPYEEPENLDSMLNPFGDFDPFAMDNNIQKSESLQNTTVSNNKNSGNIKSNFIAGNGKLVAFVGTSKNGTSFIVNNLAQLLSQSGIKTAILDLTKNKNSYYMFTDNDQTLMQTAANSMKELSRGRINGVNINKSLTVFTAVPDEVEEYDTNVMMQTLSNNFDITLMDCDFESDLESFVNANEIYLIQSMDTFTIQPLTQFLSNLKLKNALDESKLKVVINKYIRLKKLNEKMIIGGMSKYNEPSMTLQRDLFNSQTIKYTIIPFETETYARYLENIAMCNLSLSGYSQGFLTSLEQLKNMVYPLVSGGARYKKSNYSEPYTDDKKRLFGNKNVQTNSTNRQFSSDMNDTLNKMRSNNF